MTTSNLNPRNAPEHKPKTRKYPARCVGNEVGDAPLRLKEALGKSPSEQIPFWTIKYERLDATWPDGNPVPAEFGTFLTDSEGNILDKTMAPAVVAQAFAAHGIVIYPDDPDYDPDKVEGEVFFLEEVEKPYAKKNKRGFLPTMPVPLAILGREYVYTGKVQVFTPRNSGDDDSVSVTSSGAPVSPDLTNNEAALAKLRAALDGIDTSDGDATVQVLADLQKMDSIFKGATLNGESLFSLALGGKLGEALSG